MAKLSGYVPDVFVIGAQKSGTSTFYRNLVSKEGLVFTKQKESNILIDSNTNDSIIKRYTSSFRVATYPLLDVSPKYAQRHLYGEVAKKMYKINPDAKIVYLVRDPIERIKSQLHHNLLRDRVRGDLFNELLNNLDYINTSSYAFQIKPFLSYFSPKQILVYPFERMVKEPADFQKTLFDFLGVNELPMTFKAFNVSKNRSVIKYHDWFHKHFGYYYLIKSYHFFWSIIGIKPREFKFTEEQKVLIFQRLKSDIQEFTALFDFDTKWWKTYSRLKSLIN